MMSLESVILLVLSFATGSTFFRGTWSFFVAHSNGYLTMALFIFIAFLVYTILDQQPTEGRRRWQFVGLVVVFGTILTMVSTWQIHARRTTPAPAFRGDGITQSFAAARLLLHGQNPYTADFSTTALAPFGNPHGPEYRNRAYDHYAYPPLTFLIYLPQAAAAEWWHHDSDAETLYVLVFTALVATLVVLARTWRAKNIVLILTAGNPFLWVYVFAGFNDFLFLWPLLGSLVAWRYRRWWWVGVCFGLALVAKQTSWLLVPFWGYWLWLEYRQRRVDLRAVRRIGFGAAAVIGVMLLPFFVWNPGAMYDDLVRYVSGVIPDTFPISNTTLAQYLHVYNIIPDPWSTVPLWPFTLIGLVPVGWYAAHRLRRLPTLGTLLTMSAIVLLMAALFNRVGSDNYFLPPIILAIAAHVADQRSSATSE